MTLPKNLPFIDMTFYSRKSTRLQKYDYSNNNYYFITICTHNKKCIFGTAGVLNTNGQISKNELEYLSGRYEGVYVDNYIVMPNHVHAIIVLENQNKTLSEIIGLYKSGVSKKIREKDVTIKVWQRSFHDHIIRSEKSYLRIWEYITYNDKKWKQDCFYIDADKC